MKKIFMTLTVMLLGIVMMLAPNAYAVSNPENLTPVTGTINFEKLVHTDFSDVTNIPTFTFNFTKSAVSGTPVGGDIQNTVANMPNINSVSTTSSWTNATGNDIDDKNNGNTITYTIIRNSFTNPHKECTTCSKRCNDFYTIYPVLRFDKKTIAIETYCHSN